jgi:hypothetical protein
MQKVIAIEKQQDFTAYRNAVLDNGEKKGASCCLYPEIKEHAEAERKLAGIRKIAMSLVS